jgi:EpsI family protein
MKRFLVTIILLLAAAAANYGFSRPEAKQPRLPLEDFPEIIGDWKAVRDTFMTGDIIEVLKVDDYIMRTYVNSKGEAVGLYIGYFETQREGKQVHSPRQCLPGGGWGIFQKKIHLLKIPGHNPDEVPINYYLMGKGAYRDLYLWWYQGRGRIHANEYLNKLYMIWDALTMRRTDGALVRVNMFVKQDENSTLKTELDFINQITPIISDYIPA